MDKEIVYLVSAETSTGVLESQVLAKANYIGKIKRNKVKVVFIGNKIELKYESIFPNISFYVLDKNIKVRDLKESIIYIRGIDVFLKYYIQLKLNYNLIVYDFRAFLFAESFGRHRSYFRLTFIYLLEMLVYLLADNVCAVSNELKVRLHSFFLLKKKIFVLPCLVFNDKYINHTKINNKGVIKFVYLGGLSEWQKFDRILDYYKSISQIIPKTTFTIITKDQEKAKEKAISKHIHCEVKTLKNHEVFDELKKYDFGFLVRENNLVNNVASPIKFLEYLRGGVIPIMTEGIGDYSKEAKIYNIGYVLKYNEKVKKENLLAFLKKTCVEENIKKYLAGYDYKERIKEHPLLKS